MLIGCRGLKLFFLFFFCSFSPIFTGVMTPPRSSPLTVQDEGSGLNGMVNGMANGLANGMTNGMPNGLSNGISNGHIDHHVGRVDHPSLYNGRHRPRPLQPQPGSYHTYDHSYGGFPSDPTYYR